jgi:fibro-slime domain-containing protein
MKRKLTKRLTALLLSALTVVSALPFLGWGMRVRAAEGADIASVPAVRETTPGSGIFTLTTDSRFFIAADSDPSKTDAGLFVQTVSSEFASKKIPSANVMPIVYGNKAQAKTGDIIIIPDSRNVDKAQGYRLTVDAKNITVEAKDAAGVLNGLHTVLQSMVRGGTALNACTVNDWPDVAERSVYLDCGRVYFKPETIKALIRTLSWNKMNVLYLDFSNNNATRFFLDEMKVTVAGTTYDITKAKPSNGSLSQADMDGIIAEANKYGVQIIPTFNSPGHIGGLLGAFTGDEQDDYFDIKDSTDYDQISKGGKGKVTLLIENETAYKIGIEINKLYINYFAEKGCKSYNIAADEATLGNVKYDSDNASFVKYVNELNSCIKSKGMTTRMFNDGIESVDCGIDKDITVLYWAPESKAEAFLNSKRNLVNFSYGAGLYYAYLGNRGAWWVWNQSVSQLYESWTPAVTNRNTGDSYQYYYVVTESVDITNDYFLGANFAIWTDYAFVDGINGTDLLAKNSYDVMQKVYVVAEKSWISESNTRSSNYSTWKATLNTAPAGLSLTGSVLADNLPTPSPITLEATMNTVEDGDVRVSAVGVTGLTASKLTESVSIDNAKSVILYDVTPKAGNDNYTGNGMVSINIPSAWDNTPIMGVEKTSNGGYRLVAGTSNNGWFSFEVSHFSVYGLAQVNYTGTTPVSVSVGGTKEILLDTAPSQNSYETADETVASVSVGTKTETVVKAGAQVTSLTNGTYLIKNGASNFLSIDSNGNIINVTDASVATQWTFTSTSSNRYTISSNGKYLTVSSSKLTVSASAGDVSWRYQNGGIYYRNNGNYYLSYIDSWYLATNRSNAGYPATFTTTTGETKPTLTFTGHKVGTTSVIIDNVLYYIEVNDGNIYLPVRFIDYRADGMLFDFQIGGASYPYGLVHGAGETDSSNAATSNGGTLNGSQFGAKISGTTLENTGYVPGDYYSGQWYAWGGAWSRSGLVKPNLRNGLPEYTDATIIHVAKLMYAKTYNSADMANVENFNDVIYNTFIATNATKGFKSNSTTSMSAAFTAAQTWDNIQCPYDLAYYLLNNLFREDQATVTIDGKTMPINGIYVDKYKSLVLVSDGNGVYSLNAKNALRYGDTTIYEDDTSTDNTYKNDKNVEEKHFYPLDGLGYDAPDYFGDTTDMTTGRNGNFAMVSEAQFVYNPNQYFTFSGDDDVYLYINGVLALDLGGAHGVCTKTVKLSDVAAKCGLTAGKVADFKFFYMERNSSASNFSIKTNIELATPAISVDKKAYNATNGIEVNSGSALHSSVDVIYDLMVTNKGNLPMTDISFVDTDNCGNRIEFNGTESKFVNGNNSKAVINAGGPFTAWIQISDTAVRNEQTCADLAEVTAYLKTVELAPGETLHIKGIRCNLTPDNNSVFKYENNLNAKGTAGGIDLAGTAMHEIYSFEINDTSRAYVVDFGLPLRITELFDSNVAATALVTDVKLAKDQTFRYGTVELVGNKTDAQLIYTLNKTIHGAEVITLDIELTITLADGTQIKLPTAQKHITIIPATTVYYEDTFSDFIRFEGSGCSWTTDGTTVSKEQSADRIAHGGNVYGYDQAYDTMSKFSLGSARKVTVSGSNYATAKFSFYGTGFDVISATTNTSGTIVVSVTGANGYSKNYLVDTYYGYTYDSVTGKWTPAPNDAKALWQIPVMKVANLDYGKYDVTITVAYADFFAHGQKDGKSYDFWLDAVRIYDPAGAVAGAAGGAQENYEKAYKADGECWPTYMELRDMIIRDKSFTADSTANGMIFIDGQTGNVSMADYTSYGPNNELYLAKGQAVAFRLNATGNVADIQIALKAIQAGIKAHAVITTTDGAKLFDGDIATATDMYRSILAANGKTVVITNTGDGILSITNLKATYSEKPEATDTLSLTMDEKSALAALSAVDEVLNPKTPFEPGKVDVKVEDKDITVITSPDVDGIEIDGEKVTDFTVDSETGNRIWKKPIDRILKDNPEISVVARDSNGNVSAPVTAPVVAGGSIGALIGGFIGRLIKNILSVLFG